MISSAPFKVCIIISACVHIAMLYPWSVLRSVTKPDVRFRKIELTYFRNGSIEEMAAKDVKPAASSRHEREKPVAGSSEKEQVKPAEKTHEAPVPLIAETFHEAKIVLGKDLRGSEGKGGDSEPGRGALLDDYRMKVRELINTSLKKYADSYRQEGEVHVKFIIDRGGEVTDIMLYKSSRRNIRSLAKIAIQGIKEASPFPPFDEQINESEIILSVPIQFTLPRKPF